MYQVQVKDVLDSDWRSHGEPTVSYPQAQRIAGDLLSIAYDARVICTDNAVSE